LQKKLFYFLGFFLLFAFVGFQSEVFAEQQTNQSVKDCLEQPEKCGEQQTVQQEETDNNTASTESTSNTVSITIWDILKMVLATVFVVALLYAVLRFVSKKGNFHKNSQMLVNLGGVTVGNNRSVQMIKVGNRLLVIGVGEDIRVLTEIKSGQEFDGILTEYNQRLDKMAQPSDLLSKLVSRTKGTYRESKNNDSSFSILLKNQLDELSMERKKMFEELNKDGDNEKP
jgi:flagellar protein FliO/FliZ